MVLVLLSVCVVLVFLYNSKTFIYALMTFFVLFDMFDGFYEDEKIFAALRYIIPLFFVFIFVVREAALNKSDIILFVLCIYLVVLLTYSPGDIFVSGRNVLAVLLTLVMIPVGRTIGRHVNFIHEFEGFNRFLLIILPVYIVFANIFHVGESYSEAFTTGFLITSRMYIVPIVVFLAIHYLVSNQGRSWGLKGIDLVFILINICIMIVNTRRTAMGMLTMALLIYAILNRQLILKMIVLGLFFISALVLSYPLYKEMLMAQLEKRERIQDIDTYEEEGRYLETFYILDHHTRRQNISEVLFGVTLFDTSSFGTRYFGRDRPIHSDLNMIFYSTGIVGMFLFAILFAWYFVYRNKKIEVQNKKIYYPLLIMFLIVLLPGRFIGTLTYAPLLMLALSAVKAWRPESVSYTTEDKLNAPAFTN